MRFAGLLGLMLMAFVYAAPSVALCETVVKAGSLKSDTTWRDAVLVEGPLLVPRDITLTIEPGTVVMFGDGAGLMVEGTLKAVGREASRIRFMPASASTGKGHWGGITLNESGKYTEMRYCVVDSAGSVDMSVCLPNIADCEFRNGLRGIVLARKAAPVIERCRITGMDNGGIQLQMGSAPRIAGCTIENCGPFGIASSQDSLPDIRGNIVRGCKTGISVNRSFIALSGNTLENNETGISVTSVGAEMVISGNKVTGSKTAGIVCQQFSNPTVENNLIKDCKQGIVCYKSSDPWIKDNEVTGNEDGISCVQICRPRITGNDIHHNRRGLFLDLSSYAVINHNNIHDNEMHIVLGELMSTDWETRANRKPERGNHYMNKDMASWGKAVKADKRDDLPGSKSVDATGNWWGDDTTAEMFRKGPDADISGLRDYFDKPSRKYEGYDGEYIQDRIIYKGWLKGPASLNLD